jgi:hypothetical protein
MRRLAMVVLRTSSGGNMDDQQQALTLEDFLGSDLDEPEPGENPLANYVEVTPRRIAVFNLRDCREQLERFKEEPLRLAQAAKSAHLALQASLTDALTGSAGIGAYSNSVQAQFLKYFAGNAEHPTNLRVLGFAQLLERAKERPMEWSGRTLDVSNAESIALKRLTSIRDSVEHAHPHFHFIEPLFIALTLPVAARLTLQLLDVRAHHYDDGQRVAVEACVVAITALCAEIA